MAGITTRTVDTAVFTTTGIAASGTATYDTAIPTDSCARLETRVFFVQSSGGHVSQSASLVAKCFVMNANGTVTAPAAISGSANPDNSGGLLSSDCEASGIGGTPTANFTVSGTNARLTVTNSSGSAADCCAFITSYITSDI